MNGDGGATHLMHLAFETDYEGIGVNDYRYYRGPLRFDDASAVEFVDFLNGGSNARFATFNPGVDDAVRWSGNQTSTVGRRDFFNQLINPITISNRPPLDSQGNARWLRLKDDGVFPDKVAGDDIWSASWITPQNPSDYYVDLIAYDKAFNPRDPSQQQNWIIYDNIWGFSTQAFNSQNPVLVVDDHGTGQKWPRGLNGAFRRFGTYRYGTESEVIDRPTRFWPQEVRGTIVNNVVTGPFNLTPIIDPSTIARVTADGTSVPIPFGEGETYDFLIGAAVPYDFLDFGVTFNSLPFPIQMYRPLADPGKRPCPRDGPERLRTHDGSAAEEYHRNKRRAAAGAAACRGVACPLLRRHLHGCGEYPRSGDADADRSLPEPRGAAGRLRRRHHVGVDGRRPDPAAVRTKRPWRPIPGGLGTAAREHSRPGRE
jgi:hypothetical protein